MIYLAKVVGFLLETRRTWISTSTQILGWRWVGVRERELRWGTGRRKSYEMNFNKRLCNRPLCVCACLYARSRAQRSKLLDLSFRDYFSSFDNFSCTRTILYNNYIRLH